MKGPKTHVKTNDENIVNQMLAWEHNYAYVFSSILAFLSWMLSCVYAYSVLPGVGTLRICPNNSDSAPALKGLTIWFRR